MKDNLQIPIYCLFVQVFCTVRNCSYLMLIKYNSWIYSPVANPKILWAPGETV